MAIRAPCRAKIWLHNEKLWAERWSRFRIVQQPSRTEKICSQGFSWARSALISLLVLVLFSCLFEFEFYFQFWCSKNCTGFQNRKSCSQGFSWVNLALTCGFKQPPLSAKYVQRWVTQGRQHCVAVETYFWSVCVSWGAQEVKSTKHTWKRDGA